MSNSNDPLTSNDPYNRHGTRHERPKKSGAGKVAAIAFSAVIIAALGAAGLYMIDLDQTKEARLPEVDITVTEGQMPAFDVEVAGVTVGTEEVEVDVPTIDVKTETKTIQVEVPVDVDVKTTTETVDVPTLSIERPDVDNPADDPAKNPAK